MTSTARRRRWRTTAAVLGKGPYNDAHERRAVVYDNKGNGLVFYKPLES